MQARIPRCPRTQHLPVDAVAVHEHTVEVTRARGALLVLPDAELASMVADYLSRVDGAVEIGEVLPVTDMRIELV